MSSIRNLQRSLLANLLKAELMIVWREGCNKRENSNCNSSSINNRSSKPTLQGQFPSSRTEVPHTSHQSLDAQIPLTVSPLQRMHLSTPRFGIPAQEPTTSRCLMRALHLRQRSIGTKEELIMRMPIPLAIQAPCVITGTSRSILNNPPLSWRSNTLLMRMILVILLSSREKAGALLS